MSILYKPSIYAKDIYHINYPLLKKQNIKYLLFDIDNTLADSKEKYPSKDVIELFNKLKKDGFTLILISNSLPHRALKFARILNTKTYFLSFKPLSYNYHRLIKKFKINSQEIAAIGDQLLTDIKGANKLKITSILIDKKSLNESFITKINRYFENRLIKKYQIIKRGEYYE